MRHDNMRRNDEPRWYFHDRNIYCIRDVWMRGKFRQELNHCEYATYNSNDGKLIWHLCSEGAIFTDLEPIGVTP